MSAEQTDRNLLFGVLALQADFLDARQFAEACSAWASHKETSLADVLVERGWMTPDDRDAVQKLLERKLKKHRGSARSGLAELTTDQVRDSLAGLADPGVRQALDGTTPPGPGSVQVATVAYVPQAGDRYTLSRLHATGGIGRVWLAHDVRLRRDVALKELRPERAGQPATMARFLREAQVTSQLEHPGIVPIYEVGSRPDGEAPFYTMRFVRGRTLAEAAAKYHRRRSNGQARLLELRELLTAFVGVCNAVAYAHSRGVLHRDLKPQNIVLGDFGEVIVLDWGLARLLDQDGDEDARTALEVPAEGEGTIQGQVLGTPSYMAPEQAEGRLDQLSVATDVYGLGAVLYELLTGQPPFRGGATTTVLREVVHGAPAPPRSLVVTVPRPLEAVCLKALAKEPGGRYATAKELAGELTHWLADEPVSAYREPASTRLARWARRHRSLVSGAAALLVAVVLGLGAGTVLLGRANARIEGERAEAQRQRDRADVNFQNARKAVDDYLTQVSENTLLKSPVPGLQPLRKQLLQSALTYYRDFAAQHQDDPELQADLGRAYYRIGKITADIGSKPEALATYEKARDLWLELLQNAPDNAGFQEELAKAYRDIGAIQYRSLAQPAAGLKAFQESQVLYERLVREHPDDLAYQSGLASCYDDLAAWYDQNNRPSEERALLDRSVGLWEKLAGRDPQYRLPLASTLMNLGYFQTRRRQPANALRSHGKAAKILETLCREDPRDTKARAELRRACTNLGYLYHLQFRRFDLAGMYYDLARQQAEQLARENPSVTYYQQTRAGAYLQLCELLLETGPLSRAVALARQALPILENLRAADPGNRAVKASLANAYYMLGTAQRTPTLLKGALEPLEKGRALYEELVREDPDNRDNLIYLVRTCRSIGNVQRMLNQPDAARKSFEDAIHLVEKLTASRRGEQGDFSELSWLYFDLGRLHRAAGRNTEAADVFRKAFDLRGQIVAANPTSARWQQRLAECCTPLAETLLALGKTEEARQVLARASKALQTTPGLRTDSAHAEAQVCALSAAAAADAGERRRQADRATAALERFADHGYRDSAALKKDLCLASLRDRPDFQQLLKDMDEAWKIEREESQHVDRARQLLLQGDVAAAVAEVSTRPDARRLNAVIFYNRACLYSLASAAVQKESKRPSSDRDQLTEQYARRAVELLRQAASKGYRDTQHMKSDKDLDPLRGRADFQEFLAGMTPVGRR